MESGWTEIAKPGELIDGKAARVRSELGDLLVLRSGDRFFAIGNRCTHQGAPLHIGRVLNAGTEHPLATCAAHGSMFDMSDGRVRRAPATRPIESYEVRISDGVVQARIRSGADP